MGCDGTARFVKFFFAKSCRCLVSFVYFFLGHPRLFPVTQNHISSEGTKRRFLVVKGPVMSRVIAGRCCEVVSLLA